jgi:hypothetical protein
LTLSKLQHPSHCYIPDFEAPDYMEMHWYTAQIRVDSIKYFSMYASPPGTYTVDGVGWWNAWGINDPSFRNIDCVGVDGLSLPCWCGYMSIYSGTNNLGTLISYSHTKALNDGFTSHILATVNIPTSGRIGIWYGDNPYYDNVGDILWKITRIG